MEMQAGIRAYGEHRFYRSCTTFSISHLLFPLQGLGGIKKIPPKRDYPETPFMMMNYSLTTLLSNTLIKRRGVASPATPAVMICLWIQIRA
jgi:hypothetical protein